MLSASSILVGRVRTRILYFTTDDDINHTTDTNITITIRIIAINWMATTTAIGDVFVKLHFRSRHI